MNQPVIKDEFFSQKLNRKKKINVILPGPSGTAESTYPVLYLLHGYGGNRDTWINNTSIVQYAKANRLIIVLPESGRRWFINDFEGYHYEDYLTEELITYIDKTYPTIPGRDSRGIGGFSMGGAAAVFQVFRHPDLFSLALSLSGAFEAPMREGDPYAEFRCDPGLLMPTEEIHNRTWGAPGSATRAMYDPYQIIHKWEHRHKISLYLNMGLDDYERMIKMNRNFHKALIRGNIKHQYYEFSGKHDREFINNVLPHALHFAVENLSNKRSLPVLEETTHV